MMRAINHHIKVSLTTSRLKQLNVGLVLSSETQLREKRLPFRGTVNKLLTVDDEPLFPTALEYSVIRKIKDTAQFDFATQGLRLDPIILSEKPWPGIQKTADLYLGSLYTDIFIYWFQIWVSLFLAKILLA